MSNSKNITLRVNGKYYDCRVNLAFTTETTIIVKVEIPVEDYVKTTSSELEIYHKNEVVVVSSKRVVDGSAITTIKELTESIVKCIDQESEEEKKKKRFLEQFKQLNGIIIKDGKTTLIAPLLGLRTI